LSAGPDEFDLNGAILRRSETELRAFMEALAVRLEGALPGRVQVERRREGLLSPTRRVAAIAVNCDRAVYELRLARSALKATRVKQVRGVRLSSADVAVPEWLAEVSEELKALAEQAGSSSDALHGFL
jgi:hypothetical protein